jgi:hypothetical protein
VGFVLSFKRLHGSYRKKKWGWGKMELAPPPFDEFWVAYTVFELSLLSLLLLCREREMVGFSEFQKQVGLLTCKLLVLETEGLVSPKVLHPWTLSLSLSLSLGYVSFSLSLWKFMCPSRKA